MKKLFIALFIMALLISPAHADLTSETSKTIFLCDASETEFDFDFKVFDEDDIEVILVLESTGAETTLTLTTEYTVSDISSTGGTVTTVSTYSALYTLIVRRDQALKQEIDYVPQGPFSTKVLEQGLDTMVMMIQNNKEKIDRSLLRPGTETTSLTFPSGSSEKLIGWDAAGTGLENKDSPETVTVTDTTDTTTYVGLWESATGDLYPKSDGGITYNAGTANLSATTFTGALTGNVTGNADTATVGTTATITDNESTAENNPIVFVAGGDLDGGNLGLESDGTCYYTPSTGIITTTGFAGALTGNATTVSTNANLTGDVTSVGNATDITESVLEEGGTDELTITSGMVNSGTNASATSYFRGDNTWVVPAGGGDLLADGTTPLTANWDVGAYSLTASSFIGDGAVSSGMIVMWSGAVSAIPSGWVICDGNNSTPNLTDRFVIHASADAGDTYDVGDTGGAATHTLTSNEMPAHTHQGKLADTGSDGAGASGTADPRRLTTGSTGGGAAHNNLPPYYALAYIMKT